jgi:hypothetical protein
MNRVWNDLGGSDLKLTISPRRYGLLRRWAQRRLNGLPVPYPNELAMFLEKDSSSDEEDARRPEQIETDQRFIRGPDEEYPGEEEKIREKDEESINNLPP